MSSPVYSVETFQEWERFRDDIRPHLEKVYARISPLLEGAGAVLDLGGGDGYTHTMLPLVSSQLTTVDIDASALGRLQNRYPDATTVEADNGALPFGDETFEAAIAINSINRTTESNEAEEIERVLKPGGLLVFLYDLPYPIEGAIDTDSEASNDSKELYAVPVINHSTKTVDQVASIDRKSLLRLMVLGDSHAHALLDEAKELLDDDDWKKKIYDNPYEIVSHAKLFTRLVAEINRYANGNQVEMWEPYAPVARQHDSRRFTEHPGFDTGVSIMETDYYTDEAHVILGRTVSRLFVDEFAFPHIIYKPEATSTRVRGRTPVFTARKHG